MFNIYIYICLIYIYIYIQRQKGMQRNSTGTEHQWIETCCPLRGDTLGKSRHIGIVQSKACHASPPGLRIGPIFLRLLPICLLLDTPWASSISWNWSFVCEIFDNLLSIPYLLSPGLVAPLHDVCQIRVKRVLKLASFQVRTTQPWFFPVHLYRQLPGNWLVIPVGKLLENYSILEYISIY